MLDRKLIIYILLGVVAFALWEAWQRDYSQIQPNPTVSTRESMAVTATSSAHLSTTVPEVTALLSATATQDSQIITVKTDLLAVAIDIVGGNIVRTSLLQYPEIVYQTKPVQILSDSSIRYYIAQSGLISSRGPDLPDKPASYSTTQKSYILEPTQNSLKVKLLWSNQGVTVTKVFTFTRNRYDIAVDYEIGNRSNQAWSGQFYANIKRMEFDSQKGLFQFSTYTGAAISSAEKPYEKVSFSDIEDATKKQQGILRNSQGGWVAMQQRYFLSAWIPEQEKNYQYFSRASNGIYTIGLSDNSIVVPVNGQTTIHSILYIGPEITENLAPLARGLDLTVDYGWLWVLSVGFFWILKNLYKLVGNWGWAIILVTLFIKVVFYKLSESSCRSMAKMRELMPKMQALKERYADDRQKLHQATMELYKQEKINPLNFGGCLPMLIQIPFFIALYYVLIGAVELRQSPFIFWIHDLSARDPYYVLPILMGLSMFLQQRLSPSSPDPTQAKMMMFMPVIFTLFFLNFPSGLVLYWLVSNLLSILQQWYINRKLAINVKPCKR